MTAKTSNHARIMAKQLIVFVIVGTVACVACHGQNRDSINAAFSGMGRPYRIQDLIANYAEYWDKSKKLTYLEDVPDLLREADDPVDLLRGHGRRLLPSDLKNDSLGHLVRCHTKVIQVLGPTDCLLKLGKPLDRNPPVWLKEYPTKGLADGDDVRLVGLVHVQGTKEYTTVAGAKKTVRVIQLVLPEEVEELKAEAKAKAFAAECRTWTDKTGEHETVAKFLGFENGQAILKRKDDYEIIKVSSSRLSKEDRKWIRDELRSQRTQ